MARLGVRFLIQAVDEFFKVLLPLQASLLMSQGCTLCQCRCLSLLGF